MAVNYDDERFKAVENEKNEALSNATNEYNRMINESQGYYQQQIDAQKEWGQKQSEIQQANTDFAIEKIEQQKAQTQKDYIKEQKGAYTDYQKAIDEYGVNAEQRATAGLNNSGYSESSKISAYNTYQNRYASARESYNNALMNYANAIKDAQLANNSALAQIAYQSLQAQLELSLQGFQYKNTLVLQKMNELNNVNDRYYNRYQNVLNQINTENSLAEQIRQYNESLAEQRRQYNETMAFNKQKAEEDKRQYEETLAFNKQKAAQEQANWEKQFALTQQQYANSKAKAGGTSGNKTQQQEIQLVRDDNNKKNPSGSVGSGVAKAGETSAVKAILNDDEEKLLNGLKMLNNMGATGAVKDILGQITDEDNGKLKYEKARIIVNELNK